MTIEYNTPQAFVAACHINGLVVGTRTFHGDLSVELAQKLGQQVVLNFSTASVGAASYVETTSQASARLAKDKANRETPLDPRFVGRGHILTLPYDKR